MKNARGKLFILEGVDGVGKTSCINILKEMYHDNENIVFLRDQYIDDPACASIKNILKFNGNYISKTAQTLLSLASRDILDKEIQRNLNLGKTVICDRYIQTTLTYNNDTSEERMNTLIASKVIFPSTFIEFEKCIILLYKDTSCCKEPTDELEKMYSVEELQRRYREIHKMLPNMSYIEINHKEESLLDSVRKICEDLSEYDVFSEWKERFDKLPK